MDPFEEKKKQLEEKIVDMMIKSVEQEKISESDMQDISTYVLGTIDDIKDEVEYNVFLTELANKWEIFKPVEILEKAEMDQRIEKEVVDGVLLFLEHGKIDKAIQLAKSVTTTNQTTK